jgi:hypothetical protein
VAAKPAFNAKNLEALGLERLAELLIEISAGNATARRRLRVDCAHRQPRGPQKGELRSSADQTFRRCPRTIMRCRVMASLKGVSDDPWHKAQPIFEPTTAANSRVDRRKSVSPPKCRKSAPSRPLRINA